jgi:serine phosphatase RsbU (regulator of sigma subunit)
VNDVIQNLLILYVGLLLINVALSATLWWRNRNPLYRALFFVWATTAGSFVAQGALVQNDLVIALGFVAVFPVNLALAHLGALATSVPLAARQFVVVMAISTAASIVLSVAGCRFTIVALPIAIATSLPSLVTGLRIIVTRWRTTSISVRALAISSILFSAHNIDFAFLRDKPAYAPLGFTVAILIIFALSITGPGVVLELVTEQQARTAIEMETARRIQHRIAPRDVSLKGLDVLSYLRPAEDVGGDYLDVYTIGDDSWLLLGDVTGHGLGAGLVMLMAQSTISAILQTRPDISPRELNWLANRVLHANLRRLEESRHMTVISLRRSASNRFTVSGAHDDFYIVRADGSLERHSAAHFPLGLGFVGDLEIDAVGEDAFQLYPGDLLYVGTDGVTEAAPGGDPRRGLFGEQQIERLLVEHSRASLDDLRRALLAELETFTGGVYHDDVAFLLVRAHGEMS